MKNEQPLVTFVLFAFNQERYVRQAIEGAFAQTYTPLEIILSDDFSSDSTFEIMRELAAAYSGPHSIRLNKNIANLGIAGHINYVMSLVKSDFVVVAAGDDISLPIRTDKLVSAWLGSDRKIKSVHSYVADMDDQGVLTGNLRRGSSDVMLSNPIDHAALNIFVLGAAHGWDMSLITNFNPILGSVVNEDVIIPARASLVGRVGFVPEVLVNYRVGVGISHEMVRRRLKGLIFPSIPLLKRPYYSFLQKFRDFKECGVLEGYRLNFQKARAEALFPIWLNNGYFSSVKMIFFVRRCSLKYLFWETLKFRFPLLVYFKQIIQFWFLDLARKFSKDRGSGVK